MHNQPVTYSGSGVWSATNFSITTAGSVVTLVPNQTYRITNGMTSVGTNASHQGISSYNLLTNLSSYWKMDEGSGTAVSDIVGGRTLTLNAGNTWTADRKPGNGRSCSARDCGLKLHSRTPCRCFASDCSRLNTRPGETADC